jgi:kumamolisin
MGEPPHRPVMVARRPRLRSRLPHGRWTAFWVAALAVASAAAAVPASAAAAPAGTAVTAASAVPFQVPFAERAGFDPTQSSEATAVSLATGSVEVVVTFTSPNASFYATPSTSAPALTQSQVASAYGLSAANYASAEQYFESRGLAVLHAWPDRLFLSLTGSASAVGAAFGTTLDAGVFDGRAVTFPASVPTVGDGLEGEIASVSGLSSGFDPFTVPEFTPVPSGITPLQTNAADLVTPTDARLIYDVSGLYNTTASPTYATGKGIVLLLWGWGYSPSDISTFYANDYPTEFPKPVVTPYPIDGAPQPASDAPSDPSNGAREMTLDLEWSGSMAPGASLDAVYAPDGPANEGYSPTDASMEDAINAAVDPSTVPNVAAISMSFGSADGQDPSYQLAFETAFHQATDEHISLFAATGDTGGDTPPSTSGGGCTGTVQPEYPAASTQVVAVGGTDVTLDRSVLGTVTGFSESGWSQSGGGFSTEYRAPSWQLVGSAAAPIEAAGGYRGMPDVAATAAYNFLYFDGQMDDGAGTSFASPLWAGIVTEMDALRGNNLGFVTPVLYSLAASPPTGGAAFHDVTSGSNCVGSAGVGWDVVTGWGSPDSTLLYEHLVAAFVNLSVAASPGLIAPGGSVTITAVVTNATSGAQIASVPVSVTLGSDGIGGPCAGTFGTAVVDSNASGGVSASFSVPVCYLGSSAIASILVESSGYYGSASVSVHVNLVGLAPWLAPLATYPTNIVLFAVIIAVAVVIGAAIGRPRASQGGGSPVGPPPPAAASAGPGPEPPTSVPGPTDPSGAMSPSPESGAPPPP